MRSPALALAAITLAALIQGSNGATTTVFTRHADSGCATTPLQVALSVAPSASACASSSTAACASSGSSASSYYEKQTCAPATTTDSASSTAKAYFVASASPFVLMEVYASGKSCNSDSLVSAVAFLADAKCLVVDNGDSSLKASVAADGSAVLSTYNGASCSGSLTKTRTIASGDTAGKTCVNGALKFYTSAVATSSTSTGMSSSAATTAGRVPFSSVHPTTAAAVALLVMTGML